MSQYENFIQENLESYSLKIETPLLEKLKSESKYQDLSVENLIHQILESYLKKGHSQENRNIWICTYCKPSIEFLEQSEYVKHFFEDHKPGKMPNFK